MTTMKHDIIEVRDTKEDAKKYGEELKKYLGYEYVVKQRADGKWEMIAHTHENLMG